MTKIRLFIKENIAQDSHLKLLDNDFEYLTKVMRIKNNDEIYVFDGKNGEFKAIINEISKKYLTIFVKEKIKEQEASSQITLAFAPVKNVRIDFVAQKATEMNIAKFQPIITQHSIVREINIERFQSNIKEACEQCETNFFPEILPIQKLEKFLDEKNIAEKILILCDESGRGLKAQEIFPKINKIRKNNQEIIVIIGPEGGFSKEEFEKMRKISNIFSLSLGKRILRADTAIIAALSLVNEFVV